MKKSIIIMVLMAFANIAIAKTWLSGKVLGMFFCFMVFCIFAL